MNLIIKNIYLFMIVFICTFSNYAVSQLIQFNIHDFTASNDTVENTYNTQWGDLILTVQRVVNNSYLWEYTNHQGDLALTKAATLKLSFDTTGLVDADVENVKMTFGHVDHNYNYFVFTNQNPDFVDNQGLIYYDNAAAHSYSSAYADASRLGGYQCGGACVAPSVTWNKLLDNNELNVFSHGTVAFGNITFDVNELVSTKLINPVPVPATISLFGFTLIALAVRRRKLTF